MLKLDKRYCLNTDKSEVVDCNSQEAHYVLGSVGALISEKDAERLGLEGLETADSNMGMGVPRAMELPVIDDSQFMDQSPAGKQARVDARERMNLPPVNPKEEDKEEEEEENKPAAARKPHRS